MDKKDILKELAKFNKDELKFRDLYFSHREVNGDFPESFTDDYWFKRGNRDSVYVTKHARYNPPFIHSHEHFEGIFAVKGSGICSFYDDAQTDILVKENDYLIIPPGKKHSLSVFNDDSIFLNLLIRKKTFRISFFDFIGSTNILSEFFMGYILGSPGEEYILFHTDKISNISAIIINMYKECTYSDLYTDFMLNQLTKEFFVHLLRLPETAIVRPETKKAGSHLITELVKFISENFRQISLEDVAKHFHFSLPYTSKIIKLKTGTTFNKLLRDIRMEHAKRFLTSTNMTINEISEAVGYLNIEHFIKTFKKEFNTTPSQYRKASKKD